MSEQRRSPGMLATVAAGVIILGAVADPAELEKLEWPHAWPPPSCSAGIS